MDAFDGFHPTEVKNFRKEGEVKIVEQTWLHHQPGAEEKYL
jgi:hypothetical protein